MLYLSRKIGFDFLRWKENNDEEEVFFTQSQLKLIDQEVKNFQKILINLFKV